MSPRNGLSPTGRPTVAEVDLKALEFNYKQIQKKVPKGTGILGIVKANAYGHGSVPVALKLETLGVDYLGVAIPAEAIELRRGGVKKPILILGGIYSEEDADAVLNLRLTPVIFDKDSLHGLAERAKRSHKKVKVHLKVDTGMNRLGVPTELWADFVNEVKPLREIEVEGILSHFSMVGEKGRAYTLDQWKKFQEAVTLAEASGIRCKYLHMANSAHLTAYAFCAGNLVRPGIILYGAYPSPAFRKLIKLQPVLTLRTRIHYLKTIPAGEKIGYGGTFVTERKSHIATLPIGYADGYNRLLSNRGEVLVRGRRAPIVGRVCMDYVMVDVTDIPHVSPEDAVVLIGQQGKERITAEDVARKIRSVSYEVFCSIGHRVPRIYHS